MTHRLTSYQMQAVFNTLSATLSEVALKTSVLYVETVAFVETLGNTLAEIEADNFLRDSG